MLFNSLEYLVFFTVVLFLTWKTVGFPRLRLWILLLASYYFYVSNNHWLILLILLSTQIDYFSALAIENSDSQKRKKLFVTLSIIINLGILAFFKYCNFFASSLIDIANLLQYELSWVDLHITLPVGISFYTFQSMSYTIDVYRGDIPAERSWLKFSFFVAFFPQLVAGPIVSPQDFLPQLNSAPNLPLSKLKSALTLILFGLVKKLLLGDYLADFVDPIFQSPGDASCMESWLAIYAFTFQIYFDFSGYSDIAIGCSRLLGYELPDNFRRPYIAKGFSDFWKRWHISLSSWLRDYLYIPLGGNRMHTEWGVYRNLMLTMILGGLWHGAAWNFVLWGTLHGCYLVIEKILGTRKKNTAPWLKVFFTFHAVVLTWIVFRGDSLSEIFQILTNLTNTAVAYPMTYGQALAWIVIIGGFIAQYIGEKKDLYHYFEKRPAWLQGVAFGFLALAITIFCSGEIKPFIYFQF